jgi:hypothetical protein
VIGTNGNFHVLKNSFCESQEKSLDDVRVAMGKFCSLCRNMLGFIL